MVAAALVMVLIVGCGSERTLIERTEAVAVTIEQVGERRYCVLFSDSVTRAATRGSLANDGYWCTQGTSVVCGPSILVEEGTWGQITIGVMASDGELTEEQEIAMRLGSDEVQVSVPSEGFVARVKVDRVDDETVDIVGVYSVREGGDEICLRLVPLITRCGVGQSLTVFTSRTTAAGLLKHHRADKGRGKAAEPRTNVSTAYPDGRKGRPASTGRFDPAAPMPSATSDP